MGIHTTEQEARDLLISRGFHERAGVWHRDPVIDDGRPSVIHPEAGGGFSIVHRDDSLAASISNRLEKEKSDASTI